jgi:hypothetical protein
MNIDKDTLQWKLHTVDCDNPNATAIAISHGKLLRLAATKIY